MLVCAEPDQNQNIARFTMFDARIVKGGLHAGESGALAHSSVQKSSDKGNEKNWNK